MPSSENRQYQQYEQAIIQYGDDKAKAALRSGERVMLAVRHENNTKEFGGHGTYDDKMVVLWKDKSGQGHCQIFDKFNTEPTGQYDAHFKMSNRKKFGEDNNGDGVKDAGRLATGVSIEFGYATHGKDGHFALRPTGDAVAHGRGKVQRDTNADGNFDNRDAKGRGDLNSTFKIHRGSRNNTDSAGCQTIHPSDYDRFVSAIKGDGTQKKFQYVLIEDKQLQKLGASVDQDKIARPDANVSMETFDLRHAAHPANTRYQQIYAGVSAIDASLGRTSDDATEKLAAALTAKSVDLNRIEHVTLNNDGSKLLAFETDANTGLRRFAAVDTAVGITQDIQTSSQQWSQNSLQQQSAVDQRQQQTLQQQSTAPVMA